MTQMAMSTIATPDTILTPAEMAVMGQRMNSAGLGETDIRAVLAMVEQVAFSAARTASLTMIPGLMDLVRNTHLTTARRIAMRLAAQSGFHRQCERTALIVGQSSPRFSMGEPTAR